MKNIYNKIDQANKLRLKTDDAYDDVLALIVPFLDFETRETDFWHVEYQPSDGIVLVDSHNKVYDLGLIVNYISKKGKITDYDFLIRNFSI